MSTTVTLGPPPAGIGVGSVPGISKLGVPGGQAGTSATGDGSDLSEFGGPAVVVKLSSVESLRGGSPTFGVLADPSGFQSAAPPLSAPPSNRIPTSTAGQSTETSAPPSTSPSGTSPASSAGVGPSSAVVPPPSPDTTAAQPSPRGEGSPLAEMQSRVSASSPPPAEVPVLELNVPPILDLPTFSGVAEGLAVTGSTSSLEDVTAKAPELLPRATEGLGPVVSSFENKTASQRGYVVEEPRFKSLAREPDGGDIRAGVTVDARRMPRLLGVDGVPLGGMPGREGAPLDSSAFRSAISSIPAPPDESSPVDMMFFNSPGLNSSRAGAALTPREDAILRRMERTDQIVRSSAGTSDAGMAPAPRHVLVLGPDGRQYAVAGETQADAAQFTVPGELAHGRPPVQRIELSLEPPEPDESPVGTKTIAEMSMPAEKSSVELLKSEEVGIREAGSAADPVEVNVTEDAARVDALAGFDTVEDLPLTRPFDSAIPAAEGVAVPELRAEDPVPRSPNDTVQISAGFMEFLRSNQPEIAVGASGPMERSVDAIAGTQTPAQRAYAASENVYQGRGDFVAMA